MPKPTPEQELLLDCWVQWAYPGRDGTLWTAGLSTLGDLERYLSEHGLIDEKGQPK